MPLTVTVLLVVAAFVCTIAAAISPPKCPLWVAVLIVVLIQALQVLPR
jgi:hypothetical protein